MAKIILILLIALVFEAIGVVLLSGGLKAIQKPQPAGFVILIKRGATNPQLLVGILFETIFFGALLYLLSQRDVSLIWPLTALGFVITALVAKMVLGEEVSGLRWAGIALIVAGAGLVTLSEKMKERKTAQSSPAVSSQTGLR